MLAALACLLAILITPAASAAATYDITQVGDANWVSVTDSDGKELSGQTTGANGIWMTATIHLRIDDLGTLHEGDVVQVKATAAAGSHFGPNLFSKALLPTSLLDGQGNALFTVSNAAGNDTILTLARSDAEAVGSYSCDLTITKQLWKWSDESKTSTWRIGKSSTYTFASLPVVGSPCTKNTNGSLGLSVNGNQIYAANWFVNCATMRALLDGKDTSGFKTESQVGWAHVIPESGRIKSVDPSGYRAFVAKAIDGTTPGGGDYGQSAFYLSRKGDIDISTYQKAAKSLPVGSFAVKWQADGSWCFAYNIGSRLPGLANSLKIPDSTDPTTLELQKNTGNIWQIAQTAFYVNFQDGTIPNRVTIETQGTEYAYQTKTLTTKPAEPPIGQGQSAIQYDPNDGDGSAFRKVGDPGTATTTPEAATFTRKGHTFTGWNTKADGTGTAYQAGAAIAYPAEGQTLTLYAQWKADTYKVEFRDWQGRTITTGTADYGTTPTTPALSDTTWLSDPDMNFGNVDGWKDDWWHGTPTFTKDGLMVNSRDTRAKGRTTSANATIHVEADADYSKASTGGKPSGIGFNVNGDYRRYSGWNVCAEGDADCQVDKYFNAGNAASENIEPWAQIANDQYEDYGTATVHHMQLTQVDPTTHNGVARDGYVFTGWDRDVTKPVTGDTVYTAQYRPAVYKIRFDANGGAGTMADQSHTYDRKQSLTANAFTREGYRFTGWNTRADGQGKAFTDKQTVTDLLAHDGAVGVLYAQWECVPETMLPMAGGTAGRVAMAAGSVVLAGTLALAVVARRRSTQDA